MDVYWLFNGRLTGLKWLVYFSGLNWEDGQCTLKFRVFQVVDVLYRLVTSVLVKINEKWSTDSKAYHNRNTSMYDFTISESFR